MGTRLLSLSVVLMFACADRHQQPGVVHGEAHEHESDSAQWPPMLQSPTEWLSGADLPAKTLALTFDDGPGRNTLRIARFLAQRKIPATFFVVCERAQQQKWLLDELTRLGHAVGNHSYAVNKATNMHWMLEASGAPDPVGNVAACDEVIGPRVTDDAFLFRPPFFVYDSKLEALLNADPRTRVYLGPIRTRIGDGFNPDDAPTAGHMGDWQCWSGLHPFTPKQCADIYFREISTNGNPFECKGKPCDHGVVLMHDRNGQWELSHGGEENDFTAQMVENLVPRLLEEGYRFVRLADVPSIAAKLATSESPNLKPRDWDRVERGFRVHWHRLRVAETFPAGPGTVSHSFELDSITGQMSWDGTELAGCAKELGAVTTPDGTMVLVALGCDGVVRQQSIARGSPVSSTFLDVPGTSGATALMEVRFDDEADLTVSFARDGDVYSVHQAAKPPTHR